MTKLKQIYAKVMAKESYQATRVILIAVLLVSMVIDVIRICN